VRDEPTKNQKNLKAVAAVGEKYRKTRER